MHKLDLQTAQNQIDTLDLTPATKRLASVFVNAMRDVKDESTDGVYAEAYVAELHRELFPMSTPASANSSLNRLLNTINASSKEAGIAFEVKITPDKKLGAERRTVWFEGKFPVPELARTDDLEEVSRKGKMQEQQAYIAHTGKPRVLLVAFNDNEEEAIFQLFLGEGKNPQPAPGIPAFKLGELSGIELYYTRSPQTSAKTQSNSFIVLQPLRPQAVIATGIAFGIDKTNHRMGDVLVADKIIDYENQRVNTGGLTYRGEQPPSSPLLIQAFIQLRAAWRTDRGKPAIHIGSLLCGAKLIDNEEYRNELSKLAHDVIGGEMEGMGIYHACANRPEPVHWIVVKGISDWADGNKNAATKEVDQKKAAYNAALAVYDVIRMGLLPTLPPPPPSLLRKEIPERILGDMGLSSALRNQLIHYHMAEGEILEKTYCEYPKPNNIEDIPLGKFLSLCGTAVQINKNTQNAAQCEGGSPIMASLQAWAADQSQSNFFALLGEYGMGKTVTCQALYKTLLENREKNPNLPMPFLFDLRHVTGFSSGVPSIQKILDECMGKGWMTPVSGEPYDRKKLMQLLGQQPSLIIFDGLDEALVKMDQAEGQTFTQNLLNFCDDYNRGNTKKTPPSPKLKMLISCRVQFFRTISEQQNHFTGQERGKNAGREFTSMVLLPLTEKQVLGYLEHSLPGISPQTIVDVLCSVHNLDDLSRRPYTLSQVAELFPEIERDRMQGKKLYGVTLYQKMVQRWLERDAGKHHIKPEHKIILASHLAAFLWRNKTTGLPAIKIEDWFNIWLKEQPVFLARYSTVSFDQLEEDLRNSTFLSRIDTHIDGHDESVFRFAHTSLQEYFLALYLFTALSENRNEAWNIRMPSTETLDFLGQMLAESEDVSLRTRMHQWCQEYSTQKNLLILRYTLTAIQHGYPAPSLHGIQLQGSDMHEIYFIGSPNALLDMREANLAGANLTGAKFQHVSLGHAVFTGSHLIQTEFLDSQIQNAYWDKTTATATIWRNCDVSGGEWNNTKFAGARFYHSCGQPDNIPSGAATFTPDAPVVALPMENYATYSQTPSLDTEYSRLNGYSVAHCVTNKELAAFKDNQAIFYSLKTGHILRSFFLRPRHIIDAVFINDTDIVFATDEGIYTVNAITGNYNLLMPVECENLSIRVSSDGQFAAFFAGANIVFIDLHKKTSKTIPVKLNRLSYDINWSPSGHTAAIYSGNNLLLISATSNDETLISISGNINSLAWFPCGKQLCLAVKNKIIRFDIEKRKEITLQQVPSPRQDLSVSPDARYIYYYHYREAGTILDLETGNATPIAYSTFFLGATWTPNAGFLIVHAPGDTFIAPPESIALARAIKINTSNLFDTDFYNMDIDNFTLARKSIRYLEFAAYEQFDQGEYDLGRIQAINVQGLFLVSTYQGAFTVNSRGEILRDKIFRPGVTTITHDTKNTLLALSYRRDMLDIIDCSNDFRPIAIDFKPIAIETEQAVVGMSFPCNSKHLAIATSGGNISLYDIDNGAVRWKTKLANWSKEMSHLLNVQCCFLQDDTTLYLTNKSRLWALDATTGALLSNVKLPAHIRNISFSPQRDALVFMLKDKAFLLPLAVAQKPIELLRCGAGENCAWSPDGKKILFAGAQNITVMDVTAKKIIHYENSNFYNYFPSWQADGNSFKLVNKSTVFCWKENDATAKRATGTDSKTPPIYTLEKIFQGSDDGYVIWNPQTNEILEWEGELWRFMQWRITDDDGTSKILPFDAFEAKYV